MFLFFKTLFLQANDILTLYLSDYRQNKHRIINYQTV